MTYASDNLVIVGLGLIGGSLARALRNNGFSQHFIGYGHRETSLRRGVELGVIDDFTVDLDEAIDRADIIVICTPTLTTVQMLEKTAAKLYRKLMSVIRRLPRQRASARRSKGPENVQSSDLTWCNLHPEYSGVNASKADLFVDHRVILTPDAANDPAAVELVRAMWRSVGAEVVDMTVEQHDAVLASTSHLPHLLAYTLVDALASADNSEDIFRCAAGGFRDFTRIASSDPVMWRDIAMANKSALLNAIDLFSDHLALLRKAVEDGDADELHTTFDRAKQARDEFAALLAQRAQSKLP